jgi:hypothetical protein
MSEIKFVLSFFFRGRKYLNPNSCLMEKVFVRFFSSTTSYCENQYRYCGYLNNMSLNPHYGSEGVDFRKASLLEAFCL